MDPRLESLIPVAHRGFPSAFPENTLPGYQQAAVHGAAYVETDVQCTRDGVPVLYHDSTTMRVSGAPGTILDRTLDEVEALSAGYPERFGDRFRGTRIPTLESFAAWLAGQAHVTAFVEIKDDSLQAFGIEHVVRSVTAALDAVTDRCVIISFNDHCIEHTARRHAVRTGWVLPAWNAETQARARDLSPGFLFAEDVQVPDDPADIWRGPWQWAVYVIDDLARALTYVERGFHLVETDAIGDMMDHYRAGYLEAP